METRQEKARRTFHLVWTAIGIVLIVAACGYVLGQVWTSISVILFSAFLVFVLRVPVKWLEQRKVPRALGAALLYLCALLVIALVLLIILPILIEQLVGILSLVPGYVNDAQEAMTAFYVQYQDLLEDSNIQQLFLGFSSDLSRWATSLAGESANWLVRASSGIANGFLVVGVSLIVGFWVLKDLPRISEEILLVVGPRYKNDFQFVAHSFSSAIGGYLKGMVVASFCTGTMAGIAYYFIGLPYPVVLGMFTGLMNFIPFLGVWIAGATVAVLGLFVSPLTALLALVFTIVPQQITDNLISPRVMSGAVELHPSMILVVLIAGGAIGGIFGMICAIPLTAALKSIFVFYFEKRTGRHLVSVNGAFFKSRAPDDEADDASDADDASAEKGDATPGEDESAVETDDTQ
ncbi:MAG: AI-2E family transporter [Coriobacteriales bacterium]|jgi:predicted PurR-regulated permease PerM|nr:AI-2E family transporter [Coriobacteriales bacterium]